MKRHSYSEEELREAVSKSKSKSEVLRRLGMSKSGAAYRYLTGNIEKYNIDTGHWYSDVPTGVGRSLDEYLVVAGPEIPSHRLKQRLFRAEILEAKCARCGITDWFGETSVLQLDHINGNNLDNRIENLRILCANCHSLTETWGRKMRRRRV